MNVGSLCSQLGDTADSKRYSALGDAVTVNVAEWIGGRIAAPEPNEGLLP